MNTFFRRSVKYLTVLASLVVLIMSQTALAQGNSSGNGNGNGKNKNVGVGNASDGISASIVTDKDIFYTGDPLPISLRFNRGAELASGGEVDAYVVVFAPTVEDSEDSDSADTESGDSTAADTDASLNALSDAVILPVSDQASSDEQKLFELEAVDVSTLPAGTYQLGLILTSPGGDPLDINDWFKGVIGFD